MFLEPKAHTLLRERLFPHVLLLTPNADEVAALLGERVRTLEQACEAARALAALGPKAVLVKGGHITFETDVAIDVLYDGERCHVLREPRLATPHTHGTGCTLSAAITAALARGADLLEAVPPQRLDAPHTRTRQGPVLLGSHQFRPLRLRRTA